MTDETIEMLDDCRCPRCAMTSQKLTLRTNHDDWRELSTDGLDGIVHAGHDVPEFVWLDLLKAAGVEVEVVEDDFGVAG